MPSPAPRLRRITWVQREQGKYDRQRITPAQLVAAINRELQRRPQCTGLRVWEGEFRELQVDGGCNWSPTGLRVKVEGQLPRGAFTALHEVVAHARDCFDLAFALERAA